MIAPGANDPRIDAVGILFHVAVNEGPSLYDYFAHRSGGIESHFYIRRDGTIEQYRDTAYEADANGEGNSFGSPRRGFLSVETQGMEFGRWTDEQVASLKRLTVWAAHEHGFPLVKATAWDGHGVGYHRLYREWNKNGHTCPGPDRVAQFNEVFVPWLRSGADMEDDPLAKYDEDDLKRIVREAFDPELGDHVAIPKDHPYHNPKNTKATLRRAVEISLATQADMFQLVKRLAEKDGAE